MAQNIRGALDTLDSKRRIHHTCARLTGGRRSNEEVTTQLVGSTSATIGCCFTLRGHFEKEARRKGRVCPRVCLTEETPSIPNEYWVLIVQFKRRRDTIKKAPAQTTWGFFCTQRFNASATPPTAPANLPRESACATPAASHPPPCFAQPHAGSQSPATTPPTPATPPARAY